LDGFLGLGQERLDASPGWLDEHLATAVAPDRLPKEVEAVLDVRDPGLLVGEFQTPLGQEVLHERLDLILQQEPRCAGDDESSSPGELHPQALAEPDVELSPHPALMTPSPVVHATLLPA